MSAKLAKTFLLAFAVAAAFQGALGARQARSERTWFGVENATEVVASPPSSYPLFKQCDPEWGSDYIKTKTICQVGCLMSSISMGLAGWKISLDGSPSNPGNLNNWLLENDGYTDSNNLIEDALNALVPGMWSQSGMHTTNDISVDDLKDLMNHDYIVVANVMKGRHFVLATGYDGWDTVYVNDPGFDNTQYSYSQDVWGWRIFSMNN
ncbi:peptidase_C39_2 domain-containing protein [Chloropicon roscoffensis]|uniref:Peptidase_C39_2 domain-containing protein n=1 Tax=Chloropicon roscoffensis TaxID=1461544 RepID=A0AAX4PGX2_9CHLO